jgi:hypothetical protein
MRSQRGHVVKTRCEYPKKFFVFLVTNHELESEDLGTLENTSKGKL